MSTDHLTVSMKPNEVGIYDLYLDATNNLAMDYKAKAVGLHARWRLMTYHNEWFLDNEVGVRWLDEIMAQRYNPALSESITKIEVLDTNGIKEIVSFSVKYDLPMRRLNITEIQATTIYEDEVVTI
jgi:hypothetical protein